jgi:putative ABC transport system permease protein
VFVSGNIYHLFFRGYWMSDGALRNPAILTSTAPVFAIKHVRQVKEGSIVLDGVNLEIKQGEIEAYLALGASYQQASQQPVQRALRASLIPTVNGLMVVGIVTLPGMMTGQILAGSSPLTAVRYQIVVVFMQAAAVAITTAVVVLWYRRTFFTTALQLKPPTSA